MTPERKEHLRYLASQITTLSCGEWLTEALDALEAAERGEAHRTTMLQCVLDLPSTADWKLILERVASARTGECRAEAAEARAGVAEEQVECFVRSLDEAKAALETQRLYGNSLLLAAEGRIADAEARAAELDHLRGWIFDRFNGADAETPIDTLKRHLERVAHDYEEVVARAAEGERALADIQKMAHDLARVTHLSGTNALEMLESIQEHMGLLADRALLQA